MFSKIGETRAMMVAGTRVSAVIVLSSVTKFEIKGWLDIKSPNYRRTVANYIAHFAS